MHSKNIELIILVYLLAVFCIPSTLGIYKDGIGANSAVTAATWDVDFTPGNNNSVQLVANSSTISSYTFSVTNDSQVDVTYSIIVSNLPNGVQVKLDNGGFENPSGGTYRFDDIGVIAYDASPNEATHTLYFKAATNATIVNNQPVGVNVEFKQDT